MSRTWTNMRSWSKTNMRTSSSACIGPTNMRPQDKWNVYIPAYLPAESLMLANAHYELSIV